MDKNYRVRSVKVIKRGDSMSLPKEINIRCPKCGRMNPVTVFESINTDYAPDIAKRIMNGDIFKAVCPECGYISHLEYDILYNDIPHKAMIWVLHQDEDCLLYTSPSPRDQRGSRMPSSA